MTKETPHDLGYRVIEVYDPDTDVSVWHWIFPGGYIADATPYPSREAAIKALRASDDLILEGV